MPAERSKATYLVGEDAAQQLVWTIPVEPSTVEGEGTACLSNNSAFEFDDGPPPLVDRDLIFCPADEETPPPPRKSTHGKKKPEDHIPRPPNAFILFRSSFIKGQHVPTGVETNHSTLSKIIGLTWKNLPNEERLFWHAKAKAALDDHKRRFPQYAFRPSQGRSRNGAEKRKVREVGPKDPVRCAKIAQLLVEGKKGEELDTAIREFDKHHVPTVETRFDKPLTARVYGRPSSAPIPNDDEHTASKPVRKSRSVCTQPSTPVVPSCPFPVKGPAPPEAPIPPSFDQYQFSFSAHPSPCLELNTFSFNHSSAYLPQCPAGTETLLLTHPNDVLYQDNTINEHGGLSVNTSFMGLDDWNSGCSSPLSSASSISSPATPVTPSPYGPCPEYTPYTLDSLKHSIAKSFGNDFSVYGNVCDSPFPINYTDAGSPLVYSPADPCPPKYHMAHQDLDFSAFMATLPEYSL